MPFIKKHKKRITMDDLAIMVKNGFEAIDKRFEAVDKRFEAIDKRFEAISYDVKEIKQKIEEINFRLNRLERRIVSIEDILTEHGKKLQAISKLAVIKKDLFKLKSQQKIEEKRIAELDKRIEEIELRYA